jgi:hypothetical protein
VIAWLDWRQIAQETVFMQAHKIDHPWTHWIADDFLSPVNAWPKSKAVTVITVPQLVPGKRRDSQRLFVDQRQWLINIRNCINCIKVYTQGAYRDFFESYTGISYARNVS